MTRWTNLIGRCAAAAALLAAASCASLPEPPDTGARTVIRDVTVVPMDRPGTLARRDVVVVDGQIAQIAPTGRIRPRPADRAIDGRGKHLMPGLWDMHAHLSVGESAEGRRGGDLAAGRLRRFLGFGVVGVRDTGSMMEDLRAMKAAVREEQASLPELVASGPLLDGPRQRWTNAVAAPLETAADATRAAEEIAAAGADFFKTYETISRDQFDAVAAVARAKGLRITGHVSFHMGVEEATAAGLGSVEHAYVSLVKDCLPADSKPAQAVLTAWIRDGYEGRYREMHRLFSARDRGKCSALFQRLADRGVFVTPVLSMELKGGAWTLPADLAALRPDARRTCEAEIESIHKSAPEVKAAAERDLLEVVRELHAAGVPLLAGPDAPGSCVAYGYGLHRELQFLVTAGLTPFEALRTATVNPARLLGRADEGVVREGAKANLLLLDGNPLEDVSNTLDIAGVMLRGEWHDAEALAEIRAAAAETALVYENGQVWTGSGFEQRRLAVRDGHFVDPAGVARGAERIDLAGRYVVPAYGNAHAHITDPTEKKSRFFLDNGVFYVWNPTTIVLGPDALDFYRRKDTFDVAVSQGGITEPGGHPERLYVEVLGKWVYKDRPREWFLGNAFHYGRDAAEIDKVLDLLKSQGASFVKSYLLFSEEYSRRRDDPAYYGYRGVNPVNFPYLVAAARERGLPVAVHVETVHDLKVAALSGAAVAAHLPAYDAPENEKELRAKTFSPQDAATIARTGMILIPTYALAAGHFQETEKAEPRRGVSSQQVYAVQARNIRLLKDTGAIFMIGTDTLGPIFEEAEHLVRIGAFDDAEAARIVLATGKRMFPRRRIGCFEAGCEADFLVLSNDPLRDIGALRKIEMRVKAGRPLEAPDGAAPSHTP